MKLILLTAVITFFCVSAEKVRYDNHVVYRFTPNNENELKILQTLQKLNKYNFWTEPRRSGLPVDVMVPPESKDDIENLISEHQLTFKIMMEDVQKQIEEEKLLNAKKSKYFDWESYHTLEEVSSITFLCAVSTIRQFKSIFVNCYISISNFSII